MKLFFHLSQEPVQQSFNEKKTQDRAREETPLG